MGEIKSTMDIVMEKTRHLRLSEEEKEAQKKEEIRRLLKGLVVRFKDGILTMEKLVEEVEKIETSPGVKTELLEKEILDQIELSGENSALLLLLEGVCEADTRPLEAIVNEYKDAIAAVGERHASELKDRIYKRWKISGSAVVPNIEDRASFNEEIESLKDVYRRRLVQQIDHKRRT